MKWFFNLLLAIYIFPLTGQDVLYPDLVGDALLDQLIEDYKPSSVLPYTAAREYMYRNLNNTIDTVEGIYSGFKIHLPDNIDLPIGYLAERGINTEHVYPRSKGASEENGNAFSDLHHLFPSRKEVNSARLNHPFQEIDDDRTVRWFRDDAELFDIPMENLDEYSEIYEFATSSGFIVGEIEPRESVKGDIARAVFYFYTMYREEAEEADRDYYDMMRPDLCQWHIADPSSSEEMDRSHLIAQVQDGKDNPFVLDCSLALRSYCDDLLLICDNMTVATEELTEGYSIQVVPNPTQGDLQVLYGDEKIVHIDVIDAQGRLVQSFLAPDGHLRLNIPDGLYILQLITKDSEVFSKRIIIQK